MKLEEQAWIALAAICVSIILNALVKKLWGLIAVHVGYAFGIDRCLEELLEKEQQLSAIKFELLCEDPFPSSTERIAWLKRVDDLVKKVKDMKYHLAQCGLLNYLRKWKIGREIKMELKEASVLIAQGRLTSLTRRGDTLLPQEETSPRPVQQVAELPVVDPLSGMESTYNKVLKFIKDNHPKSVIMGIWGMGGVGKTTLINLVHDSRPVYSDYFLEVVLVQSGKGCTEVADLQKAITMSMGLEHMDNEISQAGLVLKHLSDKNFLLLVDDLWRDLNLKDVGIPPLDVKAYRRKVVFTTTSMDVCINMRCRPEDTIQMKCLIKENARNLFTKYVGNTTVGHAEIHEHAKELLQMDFEAGSRHIALELMLLDANAMPTPLPLSLLEDITDNFSPTHEIGKGGFAVVYEGIVGKGRVAVKKLTRTHYLPESKFHKEIECLMKAKHKNIVRFLGYCVETQGKVHDCDGKFIMSDLRNWLLCFEYLPNGSLEKYITDASSGLEWMERFRIIKGICEGLHYLQTNRILHLDLKPANILLNREMVPKIADFGISRCLDEKKTYTTTKQMSGTLGYMAPEILHGGKITFASDIYSLGVIIIEILTGVKGYPEDENVTESWINRLEGGMQLEQVSVCTKIGIDCMELDPKKRPVAHHIIDIFDKISVEETGMCSSLVGLQQSLLTEQSLVESLWQKDIKHHPESYDFVEEDTAGNP